ncbi:AraC family transcriptional regulator [Zavarzinia sp.]|uniref:AraC family transcriptional regulator n=1 Tax=Zavarzinia sp. TaxID=2027920 RepID=UPI003566CED3
MDPLSDLLSLLAPRNLLSAGFDAAGPWSIRFAGQARTIKCGAVVTGRCWLAVAGAAVDLGPGDCFLLPRGLPFVMASDLALDPVEAQGVFPPARRGGVVTHGGGGEFLAVSSRFVLDGPQADLLLDMLPPIVVIAGDAESSALRQAVERMMQELSVERPGGNLVISHLAHMVLVEALRRHLANGAEGGTGWLSALADRRMRRAIGAMHDDPARRWTLQELAAHVGMSRSSFAACFKATVGVPPIDYLTRWRMALAGDRLARRGDPVSAVALALGYESESAFATAFKRVMGCTPRRYGQAAPR